jgi:hypothetical protein
MIQNDQHVPILFHYSRRATCKRIEFNPDLLEASDLMYDLGVPERDKYISRDYWWLQNTYYDIHHNSD